MVWQWLNLQRRMIQSIFHTLFNYRKNWYSKMHTIFERAGINDIIAGFGDVTMAEIVDLEEIRDQHAVRDGFRSLRSRFGQEFDARTRLVDLKPDVLYQLAQPDDTGTQMLHGMILGFQGYGATAAFEALDSSTKKAVVDLHLFITDLVRFEIMYRLGWLGEIPGRDLALVSLIRNSAQAQYISRQNPPCLSRNHPDYHSYKMLLERDQQVFIRRLMLSALEVFRRAHGL